MHIDKHGNCVKVMSYAPIGAKTQGVSFATFDCAEATALAQSSLHGVRLDRTHTFKVVMKDEIDGSLDPPG